MNINKKKKTKTITIITLIFTFIVGLTMLLGASEKPIPVGVIEPTQQVNLNEFNGRDISEIEYVSIIMHTNEALINDVEQALNNSSLYSINFDKGTPEFNEFIEIYSSYTLKPIKYESYVSFEEDANEIYVRMERDFNFLFSNGCETPIIDFELLLLDKNMKILEQLRLYSKGVILHRTGHIINNYLPYTIGELGAEFKDKLLNMWDKYPEKFELLSSAESRLENQKEFFLEFFSNDELIEMFTLEEMKEIFTDEQIVIILE